MYTSAKLQSQCDVWLALKVSLQTVQHALHANDHTKLWMTNGRVDTRHDSLGHVTGSGLPTQQFCLAVPSKLRHPPQSLESKEHTTRATLSQAKSFSRASPVLAQPVSRLVQPSAPSLMLLLGSFGHQGRDDRGPLTSPHRPLAARVMPTQAAADHSGSPGAVSCSPEETLYVHQLLARTSSVRPRRSVSTGTGTLAWYGMAWHGMAWHGM